jgi:exopolyphosphatase/guanosine-5'-triphosphate,3'-diphosphate pyrophosphatase
LSEGGRIVEAFSKPLGALRLTRCFSRAIRPSAREMARMQKYIQERIAGPVARLGAARVERMIATSATAAAAVCAREPCAPFAAGPCGPIAGDCATTAATAAPSVVAKFQRARQDHGIGPKRAEIIVAGVAVLNEVVQELRLNRLY